MQNVPLLLSVVNVFSSRLLSMWKHCIAQNNFKLPGNRTDDALPANACTPECCGQTARC